MVIRAEGISYQLREGVRPDAKEYREVRKLARAERLLSLTRVTIGTATQANNTVAALKLAFQADKQERQIVKMREGLKAILV